MALVEFKVEEIKEIDEKDATVIFNRLKYIEQSYRDNSLNKRQLFKRIAENLRIIFSDIGTLNNMVKDYHEYKLMAESLLFALNYDFDFNKQSIFELRLLDLIHVDCSTFDDYFLKGRELRFEYYDIFRALYFVQKATNEKLLGCIKNNKFSFHDDGGIVLKTELENADDTLSEVVKEHFSDVVSS
ncbi:hypothetical protein RJB75_10705 [Staphylococcus hominis]|uniref:hypothetical protein n=1 Tax=Staphylococcus hominis TaxID=1290 RepID=UPI002879EDD3|nr:hypothetical protein [Staphylococcus hominis]MDS3840393.1 hypothetical protein [Staphylococcus hominis]